MCIFADEPGAPEKPEVTDWDVDHIDLKWKPPEKDGGAPIEKYIIEKKDKTKGTWEPVSKHVSYFTISF